MLFYPPRSDALFSNYFDDLLLIQRRSLNIRQDHLLVCLSVRSVLWQNGWLDPDAVWGGE